jgi:hypothetical protein
MPRITHLPRSAVTDALLRLWQSFFYQSIAFALIVVVASMQLEIAGLYPEWEPYTLAIALASLLPSVPLLLRYRELSQPGTSRANDERLRELRSRMVWGMTVADLPAFAGLFHYVMTGQFVTLVLLLVASSGLVYLYKPATAAA